MSVLTQSYRPAGERLLWGCVAASVLLHALLMWRMHGVEGSPAPVVPELRATIRPAPPPAPRLAPEPPRPEVAATPAPKVEPRPPEPVKPPEPKREAPSVVKPVAPPAAKAPPVEKKAAPTVPQPPAPAAPPPAAAAPATPSPAAPSAAVAPDAKGSNNAAPAGPAPAARGGGSSDLRAVVRSYELQLAQAAQKYKRYPAQAMEQHWEGTATVLVHIGANGFTTGMEVISGTGHDLLDEQAKTAISKAKGFVQVPADLRGQPFDAQVRVIFTLSQ
ncbi:MAG TPA: energy transducer TonB [Burkholderiales bacterium]